MMRCCLIAQSSNAPVPLPQMADEIQALRETGCSYEPRWSAGANLGHEGELRRSSRRLFTDSAAAAEATSSTIGGWRRAAGLPSWGECFCSTFSYCLGQGGPEVAAGRACPPSLIKTNVRRGLYAYQLEWLLRFFPKEQITVINYEQVRRINYLTQCFQIIESSLACVASASCGARTDSRCCCRVPGAGLWAKGAKGEIGGPFTRRRCSYSNLLATACNRPSTLEATAFHTTAAAWSRTARSLTPCTASTGMPTRSCTA